MLLSMIPVNQTTNRGFSIRLERRLDTSGRLFYLVLCPMSLNLTWCSFFL